MLKKFDQLFGEAPTPIAAVSGARRIVFCNRAFRELFLLDREPIGDLCYRIVRGKGQDGLPICNPACSHTPRTISGNPPPPFLVWCQPNGEPILLEANLIPLKRPIQDAGPPAVALHLFRRIDPSTELSRAVAELADLHRTSPSGNRTPPNHPRRARSPLTSRETDVLLLLDEGLGTEDIATRLHVSSVTVRNHVHHILAKLRVHSRLQAVIAAKRLGWI